jgi:hypothetical protein
LRSDTGVVRQQMRRSEQTDQKQRQTPLASTKQRDVHRAATLKQQTIKKLSRLSCLDSKGRNKKKAIHLYKSCQRRSICTRAGTRAALDSKVCFFRDAFIKNFSLPALKRRLFYAQLIIMGDSFTPPTSLEEDYQ